MREKGEKVLTFPLQCELWFLIRRSLCCLNHSKLFRVSNFNFTFFTLEVSKASVLRYLCTLVWKFPLRYHPLYFRKCFKIENALLPNLGSDLLCSKRSFVCKSFCMFAFGDCNINGVAEIVNKPLHIIHIFKRNLIWIVEAKFVQQWRQNKKTVKPRPVIHCTGLICRKHKDLIQVTWIPFGARKIETCFEQQ